MGFPFARSARHPGRLEAHVPILPRMLAHLRAALRLDLLIMASANNVTVMAATNLPSIMCAARHYPIPHVRATLHGFRVPSKYGTALLREGYTNDVYIFIPARIFSSRLDI
jgi:hypothetical protein